LKWSEKKIGKKLSEPGEGKRSLSEAYDPQDPDQVPSYVLPKDMLEDEDTS
jgi:hypothetical protein